MSYLDALPERYRVILCDVWGVVHDGVRLYPGAAERLLQWRGEGRLVVLITNAPRTAEAVEQQLERIGLPREAWDGIATSGEAGIAALKLLGKPVGFVGTAVRPRSPRRAGNRDRATRRISPTSPAPASMEGGRRSTIISPISSAGRRAASRMHCLNPDRLVIRGGVPEACAGAIADVYRGARRAGDLVRQAAPAIYEHALHLAGDPPRGRGAGGRRRAPDRHSRRRADGLRRGLRHWRDQRRRAVPGGFRREIWARRLAAGGGRRFARLDRADAAAWTRSRARPAPVPDRRPVRGRKRRASTRHRRDLEAHHRQARHPVHLQVELRQGQPLVGQELPRAGDGRGAEDPRQGPRRARRADPDRRPRHPADRAGRRGRRRAPDAGLPRPPDRLHPCRRRFGQAGEHQEGAVHGAARHGQRRRQGARRRAGRRRQ